MCVLRAFFGLLLFTTAGHAQDLKIAAAADLSTVMQKLAPDFERETGIHVSVSLGSSGNFFAQIGNGAPFDVFLSADRSYPEKLQEAGLTEPGTLITYARGKLVLWTAQASGNERNTDVQFLATDSIRRIAIANPEHAPYGRAAVAVLQHYGLYEKVKNKLVLGENISQTAQFAQSGNADAAFIAYSLVLADAMKQKGDFRVLPQDSYPPLDQAAVMVRSSRNKQNARKFLSFLSSSGARAILRENGFEVAEK